MRGKSEFRQSVRDFINRKAQCARYSFEIIGAMEAGVLHPVKCEVQQEVCIKIIRINQDHGGAEEIDIAMSSSK